MKTLFSSILYNNEKKVITIHLLILNDYIRVY